MTPTITVTFRQAAESAVTRSAQGVLCVVVAETGQTDTYKEYRCATLSDLNATALSTANKAIVARAFIERSPKLVIVVATKAASLTSSTVAAALDEVPCSWVCSPVSANQSVLAAYAAAYTGTRRVKACVVNVSSTSDHVMVVPAQTLTLAAGGTVAMSDYVVRVAAICAACPITNSVTYTALTDLSGVSGTVGDNQTGAVKDDDTIRLSKGVMANGSKAAVIEARDLIVEDITLTFRNRFLGKMRNSAENQSLYCSAVMGYLLELAAQGVVNSDAPISVEIDTDAMRTAWASAGVDVSGLTDAQVRAKPCGSAVYVVAHLTILDVMEDLAFVVEVE